MDQAARRCRTCDVLEHVTLLLQPHAHWRRRRWRNELDCHRHRGRRRVDRRRCRDRRRPTPWDDRRRAGVDAHSAGRMRGGFITKKVVGSVLTLIFVLVFNFFLFRVVQDRPGVDTSSGDGISRRAPRGIETRVRDRPNRCLRSLSSTCGRPPSSTWACPIRAASRCGTTSEGKIPATVLLVGTSAILSALIGTAGGVAAAWRRGTKSDYSITTSTMILYSMPDFWLGMLLLVGGRGRPGMVSGRRDGRSRQHQHRVAGVLDTAHHLVLPGLTLTLAYLGEYAIVARSSLIDCHGRGLSDGRPAKGLRDIQVRNRHALPNALLPVVTLCRHRTSGLSSRARSRSRHCSRGRASARQLPMPSADPTCRCSRACSWSSAPRDPVQSPCRPRICVARSSSEAPMTTARPWPGSAPGKPAPPPTGRVLAVYDQVASGSSFWACSCSWLSRRR